MASQRPLVLEAPPNVSDGSVVVQRLQPGNELDIPLEARHQALEARFRSLVLYLLQIGIEIPEELLL